MPSLNRVQIIGRLGKDPEGKITKKGTKYTLFSVAVDRQWKGKDEKTQKETDWFNIEAWGRLGEICHEYLSKGRLIFLEGRLKTDRYEKEGEIKYFTKVIARRMQMLDQQPQLDLETETSDSEE
jgi:single-strand DNA-binding protein